MESLRFVLPQSEIPTHWYNVVADMPNPPLPPLGPDGKPATPEQIGAIFPMAILDRFQERPAGRHLFRRDECLLQLRPHRWRTDR